MKRRVLFDNEYTLRLFEVEYSYRVILTESIKRY